MIIEEEKLKAKEEGYNEATLKNAVIAVKDFNLPIKVVAEKFNIDIENLRNALQS